MKAILNISGMGCSGCVNSVESALNELDGVESVEVKLEEKIAEVVFDEELVGTDTFKKAIDEAGYKVTGVKA